MYAASESATSKRDRRRRKHISEGCFGQSVRYGYKRARWRRLWRVEIQELLTCAVQNIGKLLQAQQRRRAQTAAQRSQRSQNGRFEQAISPFAAYRALRRTLRRIIDTMELAMKQVSTTLPRIGLMSSSCTIR